MNVAAPTARPAPPPAPPAPRAKGNGNELPTRPKPAVSFGPIPTGYGHRIVLYGPGGIGKSTLAYTAPSPLAVFDLDDSLFVLHPQLPEPLRTRVNRVGSIRTWQDIRDTLHMPGWDEMKTIVIDSATRAEELAVEHTLLTVPHEKGHRVQRIEDYGFGKGYKAMAQVPVTITPPPWGAEVSISNERFAQPVIDRLAPVSDPPAAASAQ